MSKYDGLDARTELEQAIAADLQLALDKRGYSVAHKGTSDSHAPAGVADVVTTHRRRLLIFEATKSKGAQQDRELNSIRDHLNAQKADNPRKDCYCVFVSPQTSKRMLDGIMDHNSQRAQEGKRDLRILPLSFEALELWTKRLRESERDLYPMAAFLKLFERHTEYVDDLRIRKLLLQEVFPNDAALTEAVRREETEGDQSTLEKLVGDLAQMEDHMRQHGVAVGQAAIDNLIYLVFMKLYEEKRGRDGRKNRLRSPEAFEAYVAELGQKTRNSKRGIHKLFENIAEEGEFQGMFTRGDSLAATVKDDFVRNYVLPVLCKYAFVGTRIDALGAVYEVLAGRAEKDVKAGQFFTPENVVRFMVDMAGLDYRDKVLDPASGTGRFLIQAMRDMLKKVSASSVRNKARAKDSIQLHQLFGVDIDTRIAKIAKMNMWIHGDGKTNIFGGPDYNGLVLHRHGFDGHDTFDGGFDVVLTNPPLGGLNYRAIDLVEPQGTEQETVQATLRRIPILPHNMPRAATADRKITGNIMKGGALFVAAIWHYLKAVAYPDSFPEWRGGKLLIILDEGILNTDDYTLVREFIRSHFYIKAVISLTCDTFMPISKTGTKTSILYAVKKSDPEAVQREPIFFGHVGRVGLDRNGKVCGNDLAPMLRQYCEFRKKVLASYSGSEFRSDRFVKQRFVGGRI